MNDANNEIDMKVTRQEFMDAFKQDELDRLRAEVASLKEQNAMLTVQVQEADKREWLMGQFIGEIATAGGKYPYVNNTELVRDAHKVMGACIAISALPQQVKSEDARDGGN